MKLDCEEAAVRCGHGGDGAGFGAGQNAKTFGHGGDQVAMAHPDLLAAFDASEDGVGIDDIELSEAVLATIAFFDMAPECVRHQLVAVADAEHGYARGQKRRIDGGTGRIVNAGRAAGDDDAFPAAQGGGGSLSGRDLRIDSQIADFTCDQMTILPACVEDGYLWRQNVGRSTAARAARRLAPGRSCAAPSAFSRFRAE